jgi:hypothetical protein
MKLISTPFSSFQKLPSAILDYGKLITIYNVIKPEECYIGFRGGKFNLLIYTAGALKCSFLPAIMIL